MINANFKSYNNYETDSLYQWDINQELQVFGINITKAPEVHFSNANMDKAIVRQATLSKGVIHVKIPNSLLQYPLTINAHIGVYSGNGNTFTVLEKVAIPVIPKVKPSDYKLEVSDDEVYSFEALKNSIANMVPRSEYDNILGNYPRTTFLPKSERITFKWTSSNGFQKFATPLTIETSDYPMLLNMGIIDPQKDSSKIYFNNSQDDVDGNFGYVATTTKNSISISEVSWVGSVSTGEEYTLVVYWLQAISPALVDNPELQDVRIGADGKTYNSAGSAVRGQLEKVQVLPQYADFWYLGSDFYFESGDNFVAYINFESLTRRVSTVYDRHTWDMIKADINDETRFVTTPKGRGDCLKLDYFDYLGFNPKENRFFVDKRPDTEQYKNVIIAFNAWGRLENCLLSNMIGGFYVEDLSKIKENTNQIAEIKTTILENDARITSLENDLTIPDYWESLLLSKISKINQHQNEDGVKTTSFAFITDVHNGDKMSIASDLLTRITNECNILAIFNGGDMVSGAGKCTKNHILDELLNVKNSFSKVENMIYLEGNHDSAYDETDNDGYYLQNLNLGESYNYIHRQNKKVNVTLGKDGTYGYVDDTASKIRYLYLNTSDLLYKMDGEIMATGYNKMRTGAIRQDQFYFIADALTAPDDYSIVIMSHIPIYREGVSGADIPIYNSDVFLNMLSAVKNKSNFSASSIDSVPDDYKVEINIDFSNVNVNIIGCIAGHTHYDNLVVADGINHITTLNNSMNVWEDAPNKESGTPSECAFDIFTINTETKTVNITRIGAGSDRTFTY